MQTRLQAGQPGRDDERALARDIAEGDRDAFERLMRCYNRRLYRLARATLRDDAEAEDALQDAYLCAYRSIGQFRGDAALGTWLSRLVINECLARLRRSSRRQNVLPMAGALHEIDIDTMAKDETPRPDQALMRVEMRQLLERKIDALPDAFRVAFVMRSIEEMSVEETAECLGIPEATVRSRHFRAKSLLREALAQEIDLAERDAFEFGGAHCDRVVQGVMSQLDQHG